MVVGYGIKTGDDYPVRDPKSWTLRGKNEDGVTKELDKRDERLPENIEWERNSTTRFVVNKPILAKEIEFVVHAKHGGADPYDHNQFTIQFS